MECNLCSSDKNEIIFEYTRFEKNNVLRCSTCDLVFLELKETKKEIELFYEQSYHKVGTLPKKSAKEMFNDPVIRQDCAQRLEWIRRRYGSLKGKRVLDVGSSSGYFLDTLAAAGATAIGVELTKEYADYAKRLGFTVFTRPIEDMGFKGEFDLAVSFHTLEHIVDPMAALKAIKISLKRDGVFMGEVPNQDDWRIQIFDSYTVKRFHYDPFHYYYFSPATLTDYLGRCAFDGTRLETVERYNSLIQLRRILLGEYSWDNIESVLRRDIFAKPAENVRIPNLDNHQETEFNRIFGEGVNSALLGNCLRWVTFRL